jgi:4-oxalocrotonate tautomerase
MPMITVQYAPLQAKAGLAQTIATAMTKLSTDLLHKDFALTTATVEEFDPTQWFVGGKPMSEHRLAGFWLEIRVTDGTNTREEKAVFVAAVFAKMTQLIGPLHRESYVYVHGAGGDAYGHGGLTQNERYFSGKLKAADKAAA